MKMRIIFNLIIICLVFLSFTECSTPGGGKNPASADTPPVILPIGDDRPFLNSFKIVTPEINTENDDGSDTLKIEAEIKNNTSAIKYATVYLLIIKDGNYCRKYFSLNYNNESGLWEGEYTFHKYHPAGEWVVEEINVREVNEHSCRYYKKGDGGTYYTREICYYPLGDPDNDKISNIEIAKFNLTTNNQVDETPPILQKISVSPNTINYQDEMAVQLKIEDDISGVDSVSVKFASFSNLFFTEFGNFILQDLTQNGDFWECKINGIQEYYEKGDWRLSEITIYDKAENRRTYKVDYNNIEEPYSLKADYQYCDRIYGINEKGWTPSSISIDNGKAVVKQNYPVITSASVKTTLNEAEGTAKVEISLGVEKNGYFIEDISYYSTLYMNNKIKLSFNNDKNKWECEFDIEKNIIDDIKELSSEFSEEELTELYHIYFDIIYVNEEDTDDIWAIRRYINYNTNYFYNAVKIGFASLFYANKQKKYFYYSFGSKTPDYFHSKCNISNIEYDNALININ